VVRETRIAERHLQARSGIRSIEIAAILVSLNEYLAI
jgi:hypothetical protein